MFLLVCGLMRREARAFNHRSYTACFLCRSDAVNNNIRSNTATYSNPTDKSTKSIGVGNNFELQQPSDEKMSNTVPSSPCNRICRYNSAFYEGLVCIGCFREVHEITTWYSMTNVEKSMTLLDAIDRCVESNCIGGEYVGSRFDGAVTLDELNRQYIHWSKST